MEVHISTQASTSNSVASKFWYNQGAQRVVTARELSFDEIRCIRDNVPEDMDIETFVHGAMCMSYSGKCVISNYTTGRDANRGSCAQPCRWKYDLVKENENELELTKEEVEFVCKCVKTHMGPWTTDYKGNEILEAPKDKYQRFVHMCDYLSSRKFLDIKFENNEIVD